MQIKDQNNHPDGNLISLAHALARIKRFPLPKNHEKRNEMVPLAQGCGRIIAEDIQAASNVPNFANSAVDGFAFAFKSLKRNGATKLTLAEEIITGQVSTKNLALGQACPIYTGAPMPRGADTVVMEEDAVIKNSCVTVPFGLSKGANSRQIGDDIKKNTRLMNKGKRLNIIDCAILASLGVKKIKVFNQLRVALFSSGAEIIRNNQKIKNAQIFDSNATMLQQWLLELGCRVFDGGILDDNHESIDKAFAPILMASNDENNDKNLDGKYRCDIIIASGGMSKSRLDCIASYCKTKGKFDFWRVATKPGRPIGIGRIKNLPFAGLPGNPVASFLTFALIVQPLLRRLSGQNPETPKRFPARLNFKGVKKKGRVEFIRVKIVATKQRMENKFDLPILKKNGKSGAGVLSSVMDADGFAQLDAATTQYDVGQTVDFLPMREIIPSR